MDRRKDCGMRRKLARGRSGLVLAISVVVAAVATGTTTAKPPKSGGVTGVCDWMNAALPTPFTPWNDFGQYFLLSGGDFEGDLSGWTLSNGAAVVSGNESYQIGSPADTHSLLLPPGSYATTPKVCVTDQSPDLRVALMSTGARDPKLEIDLNFTDDKGNPRTQKLKDLRGGSGWAFTDPLKFLGPVNNVLKRNGQTVVSFTFVAKAKKDDPDLLWQIDDVYIDPYKSG
jgi:hypothetical protein